MAKKVSAGKTIFKIACATGGAVLASGVGLPWLGAMAGSCLPKVLEGSLDFLVSAVEDDKKQEVLAGLLQKPIEQLASLGIEFTGGRIDDFFKSHFEAKESELNFDLPRAVVKVWEEALNKMLRAKRDGSILGLNRDDEFENARKTLITFWQQKLHKAQSDNELLQEFFGEKPDYFLDVEKGKVSFIDALPDQEQVEIFFWNRIEDSFTNWAKDEEKFPEDWANSIHQSLKDELKQKLFHDFSSALKKELKENERAWKSFEFASSLQTVSMLQSLASNTDQIKDDTSNIKKDLAELNNVLPLIMPSINALENTAKEYFKSNQSIIEFLNDFGKDVNDKLSEIAQTTRRTDETTHRTEGKVDEIGKDVKKLFGEKTEIELPPIPADVKTLLEKGIPLRNSSKNKEIKKILQKALSLAIRYKDRRAIAVAKYLHAVIILNEIERDNIGAKVLLEECLKEFRELKDEKYLAMTFYELGAIEIEVGNLDEAKAYLSQALEFNKKNNEKGSAAGTFHQLGWIEYHRGNFEKSLEFYDEALNLNLGIHKEKTDSESDCSEAIGNCYHHKGLAYKKMGKVEDTEINFKKALEWYRRTAFKVGIGLMQYMLAGLKISEAKYVEGVKYLDEATKLFKEIKDTRRIISCLDLRGRTHYTLGERYIAFTIWQKVLAIAEKAADYENQVEYLNKLGHFYFDEEELEQAEANFRKAREISLREGLLQDYAETVEKLAKIAEIENNKSERDQLLSDGIGNLENFLLTLQAEPRRAYITGQIGFFYERMGNFQNAIIYYQKAKNAFEAISDIHGIANCLGSIALMKKFLRDESGEFQIYSELKKLVDGTPYYDLIAGSAINLANINLNCGNVDEAKRMLQEAEFLCHKYNLGCLPQLEKSLRRLKTELDIQKPPTMSFKELVEELFELVDLYPEAKNNLLAFWIYGRDRDLYVNYRQTIGVKFMACQDDLDIFLRTSEILFPYCEICVQCVSTQYGDSLNIVPFPKDKKNFFGNQYNFSSDSFISETTGKEGCVLVGWTHVLPEQANELILSRSAAEILNKKIFFMPYERYLANDKLLSDLRLGKELGSILLYFDSLPSSEDVAVLHSAKIDLTILSAEDVQNQRRQIRKVKQTLTQLVADKNSRQSAMNDFVFEVEELKDGCESRESIQIQVYVLEFPSGLEKEKHIAFVIKE